MSAYSAPIAMPAIADQPTRAHSVEPLPRRAPDSSLERAAFLAGRAILGGFFLYNGINHFVQRKMMVEYARAKGAPLPDVAVPLSGALLLAGGTSLLTGVQPKIGAACLLAFLGGVTPQMHAFWKEEDQEKRTHELVNFGKNVALLGASLLAAAYPEPWPVSVTGKR